MKTLIAPVLFLDFDGVLHPDAACQTKHGIVLRAEGALFQWASLLTEALAEVPDTRVVLSTTWVRILGFRRARSYLPTAVAERVVGGTWHRRFSREDGWDRDWPWMTRYEQVRHYVERRSLTHWIALDNDAEGWPDRYASHLVHTDDMAGLGQAGKLAELTEKLHANEQAWRQSGLWRLM